VTFLCHKLTAVQLSRVIRLFEEIDEGLFLFYYCGKRHLRS
jgi:hypothetical protein